MAKASFRDVYGKTQGRFVVSEGIAPSEYLLPSENLPTLWTDDEDPRFEIVISKGTILWAWDENSDDTTVLVPCNSSDATNTVTGTARDGTSTSIVLPLGCRPIGVAQYDLYRPFEYATSQGAGWLTHAYVEYPIIYDYYEGGTGYDNRSLVPGALVMADNLGRPIIYDEVDPLMVCGQVIATERFTTNFDDGLLSYMEIPSDKFNTALEEVYSITRDEDYAGTFGIRGNLDVSGVLGAVRILLKF